MKVTRIEDAFVVMNDASFTGRRLFSSPAATLIHMTVNPGRGVPPHAADDDMAFFVIKGIGLFSLGGEEVVAEAGALVEGPAGLPHGIENIGEGPLEIFAVKTPIAEA
jgi:mannose-6-phosphate isomerase-like protein (cupin superfamily)